MTGNLVELATIASFVRRPSSVVCRRRRHPRRRRRLHRRLSSVLRRLSSLVNRPTSILVVVDFEFLRYSWISAFGNLFSEPRDLQKRMRDDLPFLSSVARLRAPLPCLRPSEAP